MNTECGQAARVDVCLPIHNLCRQWIGCQKRFTLQPIAARRLAPHETPIAPRVRSGLRQHAVTGMLAALDTRKPLIVNWRRFFSVAATWDWGVNRQGGVLEDLRASAAGQRGPPAVPAAARCGDNIYSVAWRPVDGAPAVCKNVVILNASMDLVILARCDRAARFTPPF